MSKGAIVACTDGTISRDFVPNVHEADRPDDDGAAAYQEWRQFLGLGLR